MYPELTIDELRIELKRSEQLAQVCRTHGMVDGAVAHEATARALDMELASRVG